MKICTTLKRCKSCCKSSRFFQLLFVLLLSFNQRRCDCAAATRTNEAINVRC